MLVHCLSFHTAEKLWRHIHNSTIDIEQQLWNNAMQEFGVKWRVKNKEEFCQLQSGWQHDGTLSIIVFPQSKFCRHCCTRAGLEGYYVVHPGNAHLDTTRKHEVLKKLSSWFLQEDWRDVSNSSLKGNAWLCSIYDAVKPHNSVLQWIIDWWSTL